MRLDETSFTITMLIKNGESPTLEFKVAPPRPSEMAERICGFANSALGGLMVIGVTDETLEIIGVKSVPASIDNLLQAARLCKPTVPFVPSQPQVMEISGKKLVLAQIPPNTGELYQAGNTFWIRRGTNTVGMEKAELSQFLYARNILNWETETVAATTLADLDIERFQAFLQLRPKRSREAGRLTDVNRLLVSMGFAKSKTAVSSEEASLNNAELTPTNAGLLLFGYEPQIFYTQAEVLIMYYSDNLGARRYTDRKILGGTLTEQIDEAENYLKLIIPVAAHTQGFRRIDEPDVSVEALREAVVNAVVHRDYSIGGTAVRIFIYPDRVEVRSPGQLMPGLTIEELQNGGGTSRPRNQLIASTLRDLPGGYMERAGSGISFMFEQMQALGLGKPQLRLQSEEFIVTFERRGLLNPNAQMESAITTGGEVKKFSGSSELNQLARKIEGEGGATTVLPQKKMVTKRELPTTTTTTTAATLNLAAPGVRWEAALHFVQTHGSITNKEYRELTGVGETTAIRDLDNLVKQGSLRAMGKGRSRHYLL